MNTRILTTLIVLASLGAAILGGFGFYLALTSGKISAGQTVDIGLGATRLRLDPAYARFPIARSGGNFDRLDLAARFPDFNPPRPAKLVAGKSAPDNQSPVIFLTLSARDRTVDPADRPVKLYARFLEADQWTHAGGLIMRRFEPGSPYDREELYIAPPEGRLFAARCMRPAQPPDGLPDTCLADFRLKDLDVQMRFAPALLPEWEHMQAGARRLVEGMMR